MMEDFKLRGKMSIVATYNEVALRYEIPLVSKQFMDKKSIKTEFEMVSDMEL